MGYKLELNNTGATLIQLLTGSLILVIIISGSMLYMRTSYIQTKRNAKAFLAENIIREEFEKIRNSYPARDSLYYNILEPLITGGSTFLLKYGNKDVFPPENDIYITSADWSGNRPLVIEAKSLEGAIIEYTLEFHVSEINVNESVNTASVLQIETLVKWDDGDLKIATYTDY